MARPKLRKGQDTEGKRQLKELLFPDDISVNNWHKFEKVKSENVNRTLWELIFQNQSQQSKLICCAWFIIHLMVITVRIEN